MAIDDIIGNFELLDDWEDRYRYLIELGRTLEPLAKDAYSEANKVRGCASEVWLDTKIAQDDNGRKLLIFHGDSDAHIVHDLGHAAAGVEDEFHPPIPAAVRADGGYIGGTLVT